MRPLILPTPIRIRIIMEATPTVIMEAAIPMAIMEGAIPMIIIGGAILIIHITMPPGTTRTASGGGDITATLITVIPIMVTAPTATAPFTVLPPTAPTTVVVTTAGAGDDHLAAGGDHPAVGDHFGVGNTFTFLFLRAAPRLDTGVGIAYNDWTSRTPAGRQWLGVKGEAMA